MAIIFPSQCRGKGVTAGSLKQIKQQGYTTAGGGLWDTQFVHNTMLLETGVDYFRKNEPAGAFMEALERTKSIIDENTSAIQESSSRLVASAKDANKRMEEVNSKIRSGTEHLGVALDKLAKVSGRSDFAGTVALAEQLVGALERLAVLEEKGLLDKVMRALKAESPTSAS